MGQISNTVVAGTFVFGVFAQIILNQVISIIESLNLVMHMFLISLNYPDNLNDFLGCLFTLVTFDIFGTYLTPIFETIFKFS